MNLRLKGFTLIELIVVIGIIAILAGITIVAVNPGRQFAQARNTQRSSDILAVLNAVHQHAADNNGVITSKITSTATVICGDSDGAGTTIQCSTTPASIDLYPELVTGNYLTAIPMDPGGSATAPTGTAANTRYTAANSGGRVTICALNGVTNTDVVAMKSNCVTR